MKTLTWADAGGAHPLLVESALFPAESALFCRGEQFSMFVPLLLLTPNKALVHCTKPKFSPEKALVHCTKPKFSPEKALVHCTKPKIFLTKKHCFFCN
jgi:hypothetical protein